MAKEPKPVEWKLIWDPHARTGGLWMVAGFESDEHIADYMKAWKEADEARACTCHPDDNPPQPCPQKFAYSECVAAAAWMGPERG